MIKLDIINEVVNRTGITKTKAEMAFALDAGIFAFERSAGADKVLVVLNASDATSETCAANNSCMVTSFAAGTVLRDLAPAATISAAERAVAEVS